jgi:hypothetical protein
LPEVTASLVLLHDVLCSQEHRVREQEPEEYFRRRQQVEAEQAAHHARQQATKKLLVGNKHQIMDRVRRDTNARPSILLAGCRDDHSQRQWLHDIDYIGTCSATMTQQ